MSLMRQMLFILPIMFTTAVSAQVSPQFTPPAVPSIQQPSGPPPPAITVPQVPKMDAPAPRPEVRTPAKRSFNDRLLDCLDRAEFAGLSRHDRDIATRSCANRG